MKMLLEKIVLQSRIRDGWMVIFEYEVVDKFQPRCSRIQNDDEFRFEIEVVD